MKTNFKIILGVLISLSILSCNNIEQKSADTYAQVLSEFKNPSSQYRSMPLWVWNNRVTKQQIEEQLADFKDKGMGGVFVHPRPGLMTPYLSPEWFELFGYAVEVGKKLGIEVWIYDENSYPSGFAGGHVPAEMPESVAKMIQVQFTEKPDTFAKQNPFLILLKKNNSFVKVTDLKNYEKGLYYVYIIQNAEKSSWYGGYSYVDIMQKKVTEKFLDVTFTKGYNQFSAEYGKTIPGTFMDEPNLRSNWGIVLNYSDILFDTFKAQHGYSLADSIYMLTDSVGSYTQVRYDYYSTLLNMFENGWAKPYRDFSDKNNLKLTGHYWDHDWPIPATVPDNMAMSAYSTYPGIDLLMNNWFQGYGGQFGNSRMPKEIRSVANQLGQKRTFSETYGAAGWDISFLDQKRIADWEYALGVNFMNQHLSYITIAGARKRDHPQSFSYHEPWWPQYKVMGDYIGRLSVAMSKGEQMNKILVIEPTTTGWMHYSPYWNPHWEKEGGWKNGKIGQITEKFHGFINKLEKWQIEYDLGCEAIIKNHGSIENKEFKIGNRSYDLVILPETLENLDSATVELLSTYLLKGGKLLSNCGIPAYVNGKLSNKVKDLSQKYPQQFVVTSSISKEIINKHSQAEINFESLSLDTFVFHQRRQLADAQLLFIANVHNNLASIGKFTIKGGSIECWDLFTGEVKPYEYKKVNDLLEVNIDLNAGESLLLCVKNEEQNIGVRSKKQNETIVELNEKDIKRIDPNVLTLDYCKLKLNGKTYPEMYFYQAQTLVYKAYGFDKNPWDNGVQFKSELIDRDTFQVNTGFEASYKFNIAKETDLNSLQAVVERPQYFKVSINGKPVSPDKGKWWLDKDFAVYDISQFAKTGENQITVSASPMSIYAELEPIYILGNFGLKSESEGYSLMPAQPLNLGDWKLSGLQMFSGHVAYTAYCTFDVPKNAHYAVNTGKWEGVVAQLCVNDKVVADVIGTMGNIDITPFVNNCKNKVELVICSSLRNTLGPHHDMQKTGSTWPSMFWTCPKTGQPAGDNYFTVSNGMENWFKVMKTEALN